MGWDSASGDTSCDEAVTKSFPVRMKPENIQVTQEESKTAGNDHLLDASDPPSALTDDNDVTFKPPTSCSDEVTDSDGPWKESFNKAFKSTKKHTCTFGGCSRTFTRPWRLAAHARTHNGERPFKCLVDGCDREYTNNAHLRRHNQRNHSTAVFKIKFRCPNPGCCMELADKTSLKRHVERKHGAGRFSCNVCGLQFAKHRRLAEHLHQHEPTSAPLYKCDLCDAAFFEKSLFEKHRNKHRTYACTHVGCTFTSTVWSVLRRHRAVEHPSRFTCSDCGRQFASKTNLRLHLETHKGADERLVFTCKVDGCGSCYYQRRNLTAHVRRCHGGGEKFTCTHPNCNKTLSTQQKLVEHMTTQHDVAQRPAKTKRRSKPKKRYSNVGRPTHSMASSLLGIVLPDKKEKKLVKFNCKMAATFAEAGSSGVAGNERHHSEDESTPRLRDLQKLLGSESDSTSVTDGK